MIKSDSFDEHVEKTKRKMRRLYARGIISRAEYEAQILDAEATARSKRRLAQLKKGAANPMSVELKFIKTGLQLKQAASRHIDRLTERLDARNKKLEAFMDDRDMVRSFLIRSSKGSWGHQSFTWPRDAIASEELEETRQLCERIYELEQEIRRLRLVVTHLGDDQDFELTMEEMIAYGFDAE